MGTFSDSVANSWLDALARNVSYSAAAVYAQLHTGAPGSAGTSNVAANNTRIAVTFGTGAASRTISNTAAVTFSVAATAETLTHVSYWSASTSGTFLGSDTLKVSGVATPATVAIGDTLQIPIGDVDFDVPGQVSDAVAHSWLNATCRATAYANAAVYAQLHTGAPGSAGTSNVAGNNTRIQVTFGTGAASRLISNTVAVSWTAVPNTETYTHVSFWSASTSGTFLGSDDLPSGVAVTAGDNYSIPIGDVDLGVT